LIYFLNACSVTADSELTTVVVFPELMLRDGRFGICHHW
jgi:hypothetical protein